jgi:hypothetical protein
MTLFTLAVVFAAGAMAQAGSTWLDRPMTTWSEPDKGVPSAQLGTEAQAALDRRCGSSSLAKSATADAVRKAGWVPFLHFDQAISRDDIEVIGGMTAATTPGCEATIFNLFVFVAGRYAGTMSPVTVTRNRDGDVGAVRITGPDSLIADVARYTPTDTECCSSLRVRVSYRIDRSGKQPVLIATEARRTR